MSVIAAEDSRSSNSRRALRELFAGALAYKAWSLLAYDDVRSRYRRTKLGPFWLTLSHGFLIGGITLNFSVIFNRPIDEYTVYLAAGMTVWALIAASFNDAPTAFLRGSTLLQAFEMPATIHVFRLVLNHLISFAHHMVIYLLAMIFIKNTINWNTLYAIPGLAIISLAAVGYTTLLGLLGTRYRDLGPAVSAVTTMLFMFTPVFWEKEFLRSHDWIATINPAYQLLEVVRAPLLGHAPTAINWILASSVAICSLAMGAIAFAVARRNLVYWL